MKLKWIGPAQHLDHVAVAAGETIDTEALGIPDEAAKVWIRDGVAEEVKPRRTAKADAMKEE